MEDERQSVGVLVRADEVVIGKEQLAELQSCKTELVRIGNFIISEAPDGDEECPSRESVRESAIRVILRLKKKHDQLLTSQHIHLATIVELRHHAADIQQVVTWLHANAPDRFDARLSMGGLITGILDEWLRLRDGSLRYRLVRLIDSWRRKPKPHPEQTEENGATDDR